MVKSGENLDRERPQGQISTGCAESHPSGANTTVWVHPSDHKPPNEAAGDRGLILKQNGVSLAGRLQPYPTPSPPVGLRVGWSGCLMRAIDVPFVSLLLSSVVLTLHRVKYKVPLTLNWMGHLRDF